jgi:hypothetical protein
MLGRDLATVPFPHTLPHSLLSTVFHTGTQRNTSFTEITPWKGSIVAKIITLRHCSEADSDHARSPRAYAHVGHYAHCVCLSRAIVFLPREFVVGILLHELGHLAGGKTEAVADQLGGALAGVVIQRRTHKGHGIARNLEWIAPRDVNKGIKTLCKLTDLGRVITP